MVSKPPDALPTVRERLVVTPVHWKAEFRGVFGSAGGSFESCRVGC